MSDEQPNNKLQARILLSVLGLLALIMIGSTIIASFRTWQDNDQYAAETAAKNAAETNPPAPSAPPQQ
ncbi:hypothetical protein PSQ90_11755 [Devosia rhodophyticola]|uniref:Uncharacterized protein n=1 Tax=Devosia rhodophyticola TaxID=3026423 RepID=A0ABY7YUP0_9HYPH|nr:hypothetical protein [Devosia rhodophyticola]WDR04969.1 hypothetical protein PSQ90_11755 [Devosia rhodophyticola]